MPEPRVFPRARYRIAGDRGLLAEYGDGIDPEVNRRVRAMAAVLRARPPAGVVEVVPTYRSLLVTYDPLETGAGRLREAIDALEDRLGEIPVPEPRTVEIPVCYGGAYGPDLGFVAETHDLAEEDVVAIHAGTLYQIYMIGFTPGFPFLGGLDPRLHTPRLDTPRTAVPAGSVGIANDQTGIYPVTSPGGWRLIGRTPLKLFDPARADPFLYRAGDRIRFVAIGEDAFRRLGEDAP